MMPPTYLKCPNNPQSPINSSKTEAPQDSNQVKWENGQFSSILVSHTEINQHKTKLPLSKSFSSNKDFKSFKLTKLPSANKFKNLKNKTKNSAKCLASKEQ